MTKKKQTKLADVVAAAQKAGCNVSLSLESNQMPVRFKNDPKVVLELIAESERMNALGVRWSKANIPNPIAAEACFRNGWAYALAAAWLRVKLNGELDKLKE